jgi:Flp pilus assembly pilin Flp
MACLLSSARKFLSQFGRAKDGTAAVEYALTLAIVCCGIAVGASMLAGSINEAVSQLATCIEKPASCLRLG